MMSEIIPIGVQIHMNTAFGREDAVLPLKPATNPYKATLSAQTSPLNEADAKDCHQ
jgi:hypothetical protein